MQDDKRLSCKGFVLRHAAGMYNILNINHPNVAYVKPLQINETAAEVFLGLENGETLKDIAEKFVNEYQIGFDEAINDVNEIMDQFKKYGITID